MRNSEIRREVRAMPEYRLANTGTAGSAFMAGRRLLARLKYQGYPAVFSVVAIKNFYA